MYVRRSLNHLVTSEARLGFSLDKTEETRGNGKVYGGGGGGGVHRPKVLSAAMKNIIIAAVRDKYTARKGDEKY